MYKKTTTILITVLILLTIFFVVKLYQLNRFVYRLDATLTQERAENKITNQVINYLFTKDADGITGFTRQTYDSNVVISNAIASSTKK